MTDTQIADRIAASFARQSLMTTLGMSLRHVEPGHVTITWPFADHLLQQDGFLHAGVVTTALDSACGYAALTLMPERAEVLTAEFKVNLLAPAAGTLFRAEGAVLKPGKRLMVVEGKAYSDTRGDAKPIAAMMATMMVMEG